MDRQLTSCLHPGWAVIQVEPVRWMCLNCSSVLEAVIRPGYWMKLRTLAPRGALSLVDDGGELSVTEEKDG